MSVKANSTFRSVSGFLYCDHSGEKKKKDTTEGVIGWRWWAEKTQENLKVFFFIWQFFH
jgi:hypothetical protein